MKNAKHGFGLVLLAYVSWGILPAFWKLLAHVPPETVMFQRTLWSAVFLGIVVLSRGAWGSAAAQCRDVKKIGALLISALLLTVNWFTYIWAIAHNELLASSMGYFISPILSIGLGAFFLREPLNRTQRWGAALMLAGVVLRGVLLHSTPWIALLLAVSFSCYTLLRKVCRIDPLQGLFVENVIMLLPAGMLLSAAHIDALWSSSSSDNLLFILSGLLTALPLLWLVAGAQTVPLKYVGVLQYTTPTLLFLLAVFAYGEPLHSADLIAFPGIWLGVLVFLCGGHVLRAPARAALPGIAPGTSAV